MSWGAGITPAGVYAFIDAIAWIDGTAAGAATDRTDVGKITLSCHACVSFLWGNRAENAAQSLQ